MPSTTTTATSTASHLSLISTSAFPFSLLGSPSSFQFSPFFTMTTTSTTSFLSPTTATSALPSIIFLLKYTSTYSPSSSPFSYHDRHQHYLPPLPNLHLCLFLLPPQIFLLSSIICYPHHGHHQHRLPLFPNRRHLRSSLHYLPTQISLHLFPFILSLPLPRPPPAFLSPLPPSSTSALCSSLIRSPSSFPPSSPSPSTAATSSQKCPWTHAAAAGWQQHQGMTSY